MKKLLTIFLWLVLISTANSQTTIYLVRHAEKVTTDANDKDPLLTKRGFMRAKALAKKLKKVKLNSVYSSDLQRTKLTVKPIAGKRNLTIKMYDPRQLKDLASKIIQENKGQNVLVVGHSNTVLETIEALGGQRPVKSIEDQEYDYFFTVIINANGDVESKVAHYGKPNSDVEGKQNMHK